MKSEAEVQQDIRLEASRLGMRLFRNNSGAAFDQTGRMVRYGLGNDSRSLNKKIKSSDLIGITPVIITQEMVGSTIAQFTAIEVKKEGWIYTGTGREPAQKAFIDMVNKLGGRGLFAADIGDLIR